MAKIEFKGMEEYENRLLELRNLTKEMLGEAIHDGAGIVADAIKSGIQSIPVDKTYATGGTKLYGNNSVQTKRYPGGQPNSVIARSVNSGSSFRQRIPFIDNAVNSSKSAAEQKMKEKIDKAIGEVMN